MERTAPEITLIAQPDDPLPLGKAALLGLQHVLAMDVYIVPFIIASVLAFSAGDAGAFIQSAFVAAGIATLIQSQLLMRLPVVQGPSFVPIGAVLAIAFGAGGGIAGLSAVIGALIPGAILVMLLGSPTGIFHRLVDRFVPPIVGGAIIIVVGIALMPVALRESVFAVHGTATVGGNIILAFVAAAVLVGCMLTGMALGAKGAWLRLLSVIIALVAGCVAAASMSQLNMGAVSEATWFSMPRVAFLNLDVTFSLSATLTMLIVYIVVLAETTGTWFAVGAVIDKPLSNEQLDRGATGEGLGCLVSALLCSTPVTGYSSNAGIIATPLSATRKRAASTTRTSFTTSTTRVSISVSKGRSMCPARCRATPWSCRRASPRMGASSRRPRPRSSSPRIRTLPPRRNSIATSRPAWRRPAEIPNRC